MSTLQPGGELSVGGLGGHGSARRCCACVTGTPTSSAGSAPKAFWTNIATTARSFSVRTGTTSTAGTPAALSLTTSENHRHTSLFSVILGPPSESGPDRCLAGGDLVGSGLQHVPHYHVVDLHPRDTGSGYRSPGRDGAERRSGCAKRSRTCRLVS